MEKYGICNLKTLLNNHSSIVEIYLTKGTIFAPIRTKILRGNQIQLTNLSTVTNIDVYLRLSKELPYIRIACLDPFDHQNSENINTNIVYHLLGIQMGAVKELAVNNCYLQYDLIKRFPELLDVFINYKNIFPGNLESGLTIKF